MKMHPIQQKSSETGMLGSGAPTFTLTSNDLPAIKDWKPGNKYTITMEVEQTSSKQGSEYEWDKQPADLVRATFKVKSVGVEEPEPLEYADEFALQASKRKT